MQHDKNITSNDMGPLIHSTSLDSNIVSISHQKRSNIEEASLYPLEITQSNPLPSSSDNTNFIINPRFTVTPDLGVLTLEEQSNLVGDFAERLYIRRYSRRVLSDDEDEKVTMGTRVGEGHRNYKLM